jgi:hypothetical protein
LVSPTSSQNCGGPGAPGPCIGLELGATSEDLYFPQFTSLGTYQDPLQPIVILTISDRAAAVPEPSTALLLASCALCLVPVIRCKLRVQDVVQGRG